MAFKTVPNPAAFVPLGGSSARYVNPTTGETVSRRVILNSQRGQSVEQFARANRVARGEFAFPWAKDRPVPIVTVGATEPTTADPAVSSRRALIRAIHQLDPTGRGSIGIAVFATFVDYPNAGDVWKSGVESTASLLKYLREESSIGDALARSPVIPHVTGPIYGIQLRRVD
jgi:hypothetical protein